MYAAGPKNPLHGITLEKMLNQLVDHYGWEMLGQMIKIISLNFHPSIKSSLTFLRKTPWARTKVEELYLDSLPDMQAAMEPASEPTPELPVVQAPDQAPDQAPGA
jgi:uncharacterized protein (DUF2132 family)